MTGCIAFSRITFDQDDPVSFILTSVAVSLASQRQGIGQKILTDGPDQLPENGVDVAITYSDPNYYAKVGFEQITEAIAPPPPLLSLPAGWLAQ